MMSMIDAYYIFYFSLIESDLLETYQDDLQNLFNNYDLNEACIKRIKEIQKTFEKKSLTEDGKDRKQRIIEKIIYKHKTLILLANCYTSILPLFKSLVLVFEQKEPQMHKIHDTMVNNFRTFLACFVKFETIKNLSAKRLKTFDIINNVRPSRTFLFGDSNKLIINQMLKNKNDSELAKEFLINLKSA